MYTLHTRPGCRDCRTVELTLQRGSLPYETRYLDQNVIKDYEEQHGTRPLSAPILEHRGALASGIRECHELIRSVER